MKQPPSQPLPPPKKMKKWSILIGFIISGSVRRILGTYPASVEGLVLVFYQIKSFELKAVKGNSWCFFLLNTSWFRITLKTLRYIVSCVSSVIPSLTLGSIGTTLFYFAKNRCLQQKHKFWRNVISQIEIFENIWNLISSMSKSMYFVGI